MWWLREGHPEEKDWVAVMSRLEVPPAGYTGSLAGTRWDPDVMVDGWV